MKTLLCYFVLLFGMMNCVSAQTLEHFRVEYAEWGCRLFPKFEKGPASGVNKMAGDPEKVIVKMFKALVKTFPENLKKELIKQKVWVDIFFNAKGEIFYLIFYIREENKAPFFLTDAQWMELYRIICGEKLDISKFRLLDDFEWGAGGLYPISKYLNEADVDEEK